jgi:two-component system response regulator AtoC
MPPLRDRSEDIPLLCRHFISQLNKTLGRDVKSITSAAMARLLQYAWPGNVRELENAIERAMVLSEGDELSPEHFDDLGGRAIRPGSVDRALQGYSIKDAQKIVEKELIVKALKATNGNRTQASKLLQISHPSLLTKIKAYDIDL